MTTIAIITTLLSATTGSSCAAIDNGPNLAAFSVRGRPAVVRRYADYGDSLGYDGPVPRRAWAASRLAESALTVGPPSRKVVIACTN